MSGTAAPGRFTMSSEAEHLGRLRQWLRGALAGLGIDRATGSALLLAVGELCANSIEHAYEGRGGQSIAVSVRGYDDRVEIEVEDWGKAFDPARYVEPDLESLPDHGMGIHLVRRIADSVAVDVEREHGTRWTLIKYRPTGAATVAPIDDSAPTRPGETMDIDVSKSGAISVVAPQGDLDMAAADKVKRTLTDLVDKGGRKLLIDLEQVGYIDSSGLGALVASMKHARGAGGDMRLCGLQDDVRAIFEMTRLIKAITVHANRSEALGAWA